MEYNAGTGSFQSEFLEQILDTKFYYGIPYELDEKKYREVYLKYNKCEDIDIKHNHRKAVTFIADMCEREDDGKIWHRTFFVWPADDWEYDTFMFDEIDYQESLEEEYEKFVRELLSCVKGLSINDAAELAEKKRKEMNKTKRELNRINKMIMCASIKE